jgi:alpha-ribazole phosphatase
VDLYLIRHPRPLVADGICYGRTDLALAASPIADAERLRPLLPAEASLHTSPLRRCLELARAIGPEPRLDARLQEMYFGTWEGRAWDDIHREDPQALDRWAEDTANAAPHGGETVASLQARALAWVAEQAEAGVETAVVVTHSGVLKALCGHWLGLAPAEWFRLHFDFAAVSRVELGNQGPRIRFLNR